MSIKQSINLLKFDIAEQEKFYHSLKFFYRATSGFTLALLLYYGSFYYEYFQKSGQLKSEKTRLATLDSLLKEKEELKKSLAPSSELTESLESQQSLKRQREEIVKFLKMKESPVRFSLLLTDLNTSTTSGMQIDTVAIGLYGEDVHFTGLSLNAEVLSDWIEKLKVQPEFRGVIFDAVSIKRQEATPYYRFTLGSAYVA